MKGQWAARFLDGQRTTRWHAIESEIADRSITYCGREMKHRTERGVLMVADIQQEGATCQVCMLVPPS